MKRAAIFALFIALAGVASAKNDKNTVEIQQIDGGVKFHIENLKAPKELLPEISAEGCWKGILGETGVNGTSANILTQSAGDAQMVRFTKNTCFEGFLTAFDKHYSLVLSPDMVWLLIAQGISTQINEHAEELRDRLVDFDGQKTLRVVLKERDALKYLEDWPGIVGAFSDSISSMKSPLADIMTCDFSTTGPVELVSSQITLMESVKKYFKYEVMLIGCGIPDITLLGTPDDWKKIRARLEYLDTLDLKWWRKQLEPVLDEFVNASEGNVNRRFWMNMVGKVSDESGTRGGCLDLHQPATYDGWFVCFFPFCKVYNDEIVRTPEVVSHETKVCADMKKADVLYRIVDDFGNDLEVHNLELWAGFIGMELDKADVSLKPVISWMLREKSGSETYAEKLDKSELKMLSVMGKTDFNIHFYSYDSENGSQLFCTSLPADSMAEHANGKVDDDCKMLKVVSLDALTVPSDLGKWCRKNHIERLVIKAPLTEAQQQDILSQFPAAELTVL